MSISAGSVSVMRSDFFVEFDEMRSAVVDYGSNFSKSPRVVNHIYRSVSDSELRHDSPAHILDRLVHPDPASTVDSGITQPVLRNALSYEIAVQRGVHLCLSTKLHGLAAPYHLRIQRRIRAIRNLQLARDEHRAL